jgi:hypothetical protein
MMASTSLVLGVGCSSEGDATQDPAEASSTVAAETSAAEESGEGVSLTVTFDGDNALVWVARPGGVSVTE